ncbi:hypothetical protein ACVQ11_005781 [Escherichia coli]
MMDKFEIIEELVINKKTIVLFGNFSDGDNTWGKETWIYKGNGIFNYTLDDEFSRDCDIHDIKNGLFMDQIQNIQVL